jgi:hypothetical protein
MQGKSRVSRMLMLAAMQAMMLGPGESRADDEMYAYKGTPNRNPWDRINLTKSERRGKTYDELQAMRKAKWEAGK